MAYFEQKRIGRFSRFFADFRAKCFCSKSAQMKTLVSKVQSGYGYKTLWYKIFWVMYWKNWAYVVSAPRKMRFLKMLCTGTYYFGFQWLCQKEAYTPRYLELWSFFVVIFFQLGSITNKVCMVLPHRWRWGTIWFLFTF